MSNAQKCKKHLQSHSLGEERQGLLILGSHGDVSWGTVLPSTRPGGHLALLIVVLLLCAVKHRLLSTAAVLLWEKGGGCVEFNASLSCFKQ